MHHPRLFKPESIANVQIKIQIVESLETLEARTAIGLQAFGYHLNRTLLKSHLGFENVKSMNILVTGGARYIGSHTCVKLINAGHQVVVFENLTNSHPETLRRIERITGRQNRNG